MTEEEIAAVARGLTKAQRAALLHAPEDCEWMGRDNLGGFARSFAAMDRPDLGKALCEVRCDIRGVFDARLNETGLAVRAWLQANP